MIEDVLKSFPENHPGRTPFLGLFAYTLQDQFERTKEIHDLNTVVEANEEGLKLTGKDHPVRLHMVVAIGRFV